MWKRPDMPPAAPPRRDLTIARALNPTVSFYRYLYNTVGERWYWVDRRKLPDAELREIIQDPSVSIHVLYAGGTPAGYAELDSRCPPDIELAYFGLIPEFIGQGLGSYLLRWITDTAWSSAPKRFWLHTCTLDHPKALEMYLHAGFSTYDAKTEICRVPADFPVLPEDVRCPASEAQGLQDPPVA
jgi:GNAT superfamily N-acetyltransferase